MSPSRRWSRCAFGWPALVGCTLVACTSGDLAQVGADASGTDVGSAADAGPPPDAGSALDVGAPADARVDAPPVTPPDGSAADLGGMPELDAAPPAPDAGGGCTTIDDPAFHFEVTDDEPSRQVMLPLASGTAYRTLTVETDVQPRWNGECFNPAGRPPGPMAVFQYLLEIRRGSAWCRGGNLLELTVRGPGTNRIGANSYFSDGIGSRCTELPEHVAIEPASHDLEEGMRYPVRVHYDLAAHTVQADIGERGYSGDADPAVTLVGNPDVPIQLVFSLERYSECYDPTTGAKSDSAPCCHRPSTGWIYRGLRIVLCE